MLQRRRPVPTISSHVVMEVVLTIDWNVMEDRIVLTALTNVIVVWTIRRALFFLFLENIPVKSHAFKVYLILSRRRLNSHAFASTVATIVSVIFHYYHTWNFTSSADESNLKLLSPDAFNVTETLCWGMGRDGGKGRWGDKGRVKEGTKESEKRRGVGKWEVNCNLTDSSFANLSALQTFHTTLYFVWLYKQFFALLLCAEFELNVKNLPEVLFRSADTVT